MVFATMTMVCAATAVWVLLGSGLRPAPRPATPRRIAPAGPVARSVASAVAVVAVTALLGAVAGGVVLGGAVWLWWRGARARTAPGRLPITGDLPVLIGLIASGIRSGATPPACLVAVSDAARGPLGTELAAVAERLRLGAEPTAAWRRSALPEPLVAVGRDLARAADTGAPVADLLDRHVSDLRRSLRARATARVERLGVLVVAPLGLCFLPAFVLIGLVPMAAELLGSALAP
ncbi:type II secretion system F family protein [Nocardiopsis sp. MG754419]|uniref:type II secretion system F family protein n=1 Tax=Nocardiopsis sp. MG754419 TaxID=2259865 RepID=UPI001BA772B5|nr:type II secretion system F family protein [Nocardiopsis sp. MG754419]MBR8741999.1 type II secretion protein F [Nocardiopsis sp. MG754419]